MRRLPPTSISTEPATIRELAFTLTEERALTPHHHQRRLHTSGLVGSWLLFMVRLHQPPVTNGHTAIKDTNCLREDITCTVRRQAAISELERLCFGTCWPQVM